MHRAGAAVEPARHARPRTPPMRPSMRQRVSLAALALPRLSRYRDTGAAAIEFGLTRELGVGPLTPDSLLGFALDASDAVHAVTGDGRQRIAVPNRFAPRDGVDVRVLAPSAADGRALQRHRLPAAAAGPAGAGRHAPRVRPRGADAVRTARARRRDLPARRRRRSTPAAPTASACRATPSASKPGRGLPHHPRVADPGPVPPRRAPRLRGRDRERDGRTTPYIVPLGHHIVAGHYVLRVEA